MVKVGRVGARPLTLLLRYKISNHIPAALCPDLGVCFGPGTSMKSQTGHPPCPRCACKPFSVGASSRRNLNLVFLFWLVSMDSSEPGSSYRCQSKSCYCRFNYSACRPLSWTDKRRYSKRAGAAESVTIAVELVLRWLKAWKGKATSHESLCLSPAQWRAKFAECIQAVGLEALDFRPYSLRRGGATHWFNKTGSLDRVVVLGPWAAHKTARIYINEGVATLAEMALPKSHMRPYLTIFRNLSHKPKFTWAPSSKWGTWRVGWLWFFPCVLKCLRLGTPGLAGCYLRGIKD